MSDITFQGNPLNLEGSRLSVGNTAPDFTLIKQDLSPMHLKDVSGIKIISVIPSIDTPVCDIQTRRFNKEASEIKGATVITVSMDLPFAQARWCGAIGVENMIVASDYADRDFGKKYGLLIKELKLLSRAVLVLDKDNKVVYTEYLKEITNEPDYKAAIEAVKKLL